MLLWGLLAVKNLCRTTIPVQSYRHLSSEGDATSSMPINKFFLLVELNKLLEYNEQCYKDGLLVARMVSIVGFLRTLVKALLKLPSITH